MGYPEDVRAAKIPEEVLVITVVISLFLIAECVMLLGCVFVHHEHPDPHVFSMH